MRTRSVTLLLFGFALAVAGLLIPWWPLSLLGVLVAVLSGQWALALVLGLLLDLIYGEPVGQWHFLHVPFTLLAIVLVCIERYSAKYFLDSVSEYL